jgi:hypothetical protein
MPMSIKCQKHEKKMTINVIQHDDRLQPKCIARDCTYLSKYKIYRNFCGVLSVHEKIRCC